MLMDNLIEKIKNGENLQEIIEFVGKDIYINGPISTLNMEILSYLKYYQKEFFAQYEGDILQRMGIFYKENEKGIIIYIYASKDN